MAKKLREALVKACDPFGTLKGSSVALLLSGGVDSNSIGFALEEAGAKVWAYSFYVEGNESYDYLKAKEVASKMQWPFKGIKLPNDPRIIKEDMTILRDEYNCKNKTQYECIWPLIYTLKEIPQNNIYMGYGADGHFGSRKDVSIKFRHDKAGFDNFRHDYFYSDKSIQKRQIYYQTFSKHGKTLHTPYIDDGVYDFFIQYGLEELRKPKQKHHVREAFAEEFDKVGKIKNHWNYQLCAGIDVIFQDALIDDPIFNPKKRERMMDVYRDWTELKQSNDFEELFKVDKSDVEAKTVALGHCVH